MTNGQLRSQFPGDTTADADSDVVEEAICPFPGLRPFRDTESHLFFGRETQRNDLLARLSRSRFLAVLGTSGTGKSSLVYAGLIPALRGGYLPGARSRWRIVSFNPGSDPLGRLEQALATVPELGVPSRDDLRQSALALARTLRERIANGSWRPDANLLIHVDQFEEIFRGSWTRSVGNWDERTSFVKLLLEASEAADLPLYVVITMRSEYLGDCARFRGLPEAINAGQFLVPRMTREHWRMAIEQPVRLAGDRISPQLVQRLLNDVATLRRQEIVSPDDSSDDQSDELPLLQHVLQRTWQQFDERRRRSPPASSLQMDIEDYEHESVRTVHNALSVDLDRAAADAAREVADGQEIVRAIFVRLRIRDNMGREVRDPVSFDDLCRVVGAPREDVSRVIDEFRTHGRTFLLPEYPKSVDDSTQEINVPHECLLRRWRVLREEWVPQEEEKRRQYLRLLLAASEGQPLTGARLQLAREWWTVQKPTAAWAHRYDLEARDTPASPGDGAAADAPADRFAHVERFLRGSIAEEEARAAEAESRRTRDRWMRRTIPAVAVVIVALVGVAVTLLMLYRDSRSNERDARRNWTLAVSQLLASRAQLVGSNIASQPSAALLALAAIKFVQANGEQGLTNLESRTVLTNVLARTATPEGSIDAGGDVSALETLPGGVLIAGTRDGIIRIMTPGQPDRMLMGGRNPDAFAVSSRQDLLVVTHSGGGPTIEIWRLDTGEQVAGLSCAYAPTGEAVFGPDDTSVLVPCGKLYEWPRSRWRTGEMPEVVAWSSEYQVRAVDVRSDGLIGAIGEKTGNPSEDLLLYSRSRPLVTVSYATGQSGARLMFLPRDRLVGADNAGTVRLWQIPATGEPGPPLALPTGSNVVKLAGGISEDTFLTFSADGTVRLWDTTGVLVATAALGQQIDRVAVSVDTRQVVAADKRRINRWTAFGLDTLQLVPSAPSSGGLAGILRNILPTRGAPVLRAGRVLVTTASGFDVWERSTPVSHVSVRAERVPSIFFMARAGLSQDGAAHARPTGTGIAYSVVENGELVERWTKPHGLQSPLPSIRFSSDSRSLAVLSPIGQNQSTPDGAGQASAPRSMVVFDAADGTRQGPFEIPPGDILAVLPRGVLLMRRPGGHLAIIDPAEQANVRDLGPAPRVGGIQPLAVSKTGSLIAVADFGYAEGAGFWNGITVWKAGAPLGTWKVDGNVTALAFSESERYLASADDAGTVHVFAVPATATPALTVLPELSRIEHSARPTEVSFSQDERYLVVLDRRSVRWYFWQQNDLVSETCARLGTSMSQQQWRQYIPQEFQTTTEPFLQQPCPTGLVHVIQ